MIFFVGSVFSPTYFSARSGARSVPAADHCAVNAVLYRRGRGRWAFTEPSAATVDRRRDTFAVSNSSLHRTDNSLTVLINERTAPWGTPLRGRIQLELSTGAPYPFALDRAGEHHWWPVGARAKAVVELDDPKLSFRGSGYHDCNFGRVPLEQSFRGWNWSRTEIDGDVAITYDVVEKDGARRPLAMRICDHGLEPLRADVTTKLPRGAWRVDRQTRSQATAELVRTFEDTPFYTRSLLQTRFDQQTRLTMHESLNLERFEQPWVQFLLPFRIRRGQQR